MNEWSFISQPGCQAELLSQLWWVEDKLEYEVPCDRTMHSREMPWRKRYYPTNKLLFGRRYFQKDYSEEDDVGGRRMKEMRSLCRSSETAQRQNVVGRKTLLHRQLFCLRAGVFRDTLRRRSGKKFANWYCFWGNIVMQRRLSETYRSWKLFSRSAGPQQQGVVGRCSW